jgi:superfamily II DNA or RNA helicase
MWTHQEEGVEWSLARRSALLHMGMGCGKSRVALEVIRRRGHKLTLVCCPKAVVPAWGKQAKLWYPDCRVLLLEKGTSDQKAKQITAATADKSPLVVVVNYESAFRIKVIEKMAWDCLVYDECHRLKAPSGATSRWAARMGKKNQSAQRIGLSGTLLAQGPMDAFGVWRAVESPECETFGLTYTGFRATYAYTNPAIPGMILSYRNMEKFGTLVAQTTFHRRSEDVLDLPDIMHQQVDVHLSPAESRLYREIEGEFCAVMEGGAVTPANVLVQLIRLLEVCGGSVHYDGEATARTIGDRPSKAAALSEILEDLPPDEPVVVFHNYSADGHAAAEECRKLGRSVSRLNGSINQLAEWQEGKTNVLVVNTASGGVGIDLTRAAYGVFYSCGHSLSQYLQAVARLHRPGQLKKTHFYSLVAVDDGRQTVDGKVYDALERRQEVIDAIIGGYAKSQRGSVV